MPKSGATQSNGAGHDAASGKSANEKSAADRTLTPRGRDRRRALLDFATKRFAENGFHPTSVSDIVDGIGVGKGVFYWYFPSKDDLLLEILREALYDLRSAQRGAIGEATGPLERLELGVRSSMAWSAQHPEVIRLVMFAWTEERFAGALRKGRQVTVADTARHVRAAMEQNLIADGDATMLAAAVCGITDELSRQYAVGEGSSHALSDEVLETAVRMCVYGVAGRR